MHHPRGLAPLLQHIDDLRLFPEAAHRVLRVARSDRSTLDDMQAAVASDGVLAGRVLKMANAPIHHRGRRVDTLDRAIQMLGFLGTRDIALALALGSIGRDRTPWGAHLWAHGIMTSQAAAAIAGHVRRNPPKGVFLAGLLHDIGRQLMLVLDPEVTDAIQRLEQNGGDTYALEQSAFGVDHATLGAACLARWSFGEALTDAIRAHHHPLSDDHGAADATFVAVLQLGDAIAHAIAHDLTEEATGAQLADHPAARHLAFRPARIEACYRAALGQAEAWKAAA